MQKTSLVCCAGGPWTRWRLFLLLWRRTSRCCGKTRACSSLRIAPSLPVRGDQRRILLWQSGSPAASEYVPSRRRRAANSRQRPREFRRFFTSNHVNFRMGGRGRSTVRAQSGFIAFKMWLQSSFAWPCRNMIWRLVEAEGLLLFFLLQQNSCTRMKRLEERRSLSSCLMRFATPSGMLQFEIQGGWLGCLLVLFRVQCYCHHFVSQQKTCLPKKIKHTDLSVCFPEYKGERLEELLSLVFCLFFKKRRNNQDFDAASKFMQNKFLNLNRNAAKQIYPHMTCGMSYIKTGV